MGKGGAAGLGRHRDRELAAFQGCCCQTFTTTHVTHHCRPVFSLKQATTSASLSGATPPLAPAHSLATSPCHPPLPHLVYSWKQATMSTSLGGATPQCHPTPPSSSFPRDSTMSPTMSHLVYSWKQSTTSASLSGATLCLISSKSNCLQALMLQHAPEDEDTGKQT